jgi:FkbM family methyltransferase
LKIKYNTSVLNYFKYKAFKGLIGSKHNSLTKKSIYFSVFLNDFVSNSVQVSGLYEREILFPLFEILYKFFDFNKSTAIDIGANIGNHTVFFSDIFANVISFEPNPITYKLLYVNTHLIKNVYVVNLGLSDTAGELPLSVFPGNIGGSSARTNFNRGLEHKIELIRLDDFQELPANIELIKIDVEGMEDQVINGSKEVIISNQPIILFEQGISEFSNGTSYAIDLLKGLGYSIFTLNESHYAKNKLLRALKRLPLMLINGSLTYKLQKIEIFNPNNYSMLIAIHQSKVASNILF